MLRCDRGFPSLAQRRRGSIMLWYARLKLRSKYREQATVHSRGSDSESQSFADLNIFSLARRDRARRVNITLSRICWASPSPLPGPESCFIIMLLAKYLEAPGHPAAPADDSEDLSSAGDAIYTSRENLEMY